MNRRAWLWAVGLIVSISGCGSDIGVEGEWDLTLSLFDTYENVAEDQTDLSSFVGRLSLSQTFDRFRGTGYVWGAGGSDCRVEFDVEGTVLDESTIPVKFDFSDNTCQQDILEADATMTLKLIDDGAVLFGHNTYARENQKLYASASLRLYD